MSDTEQDREELLVLYQVTVSDLAYFKSNEWSVTNYALLLMAGTAGVRQLLGPSIEMLERVVLSILVSCSVNSFKNAVDGVDDFIGRFGPSERLRILVVDFKVIANGLLQCRY